MIRNKLWECQSPGETNFKNNFLKRTRKRKKKEEKRLFCEPKTTQRIFKSEDSKGLEESK